MRFYIYILLLIVVTGMLLSSCQPSETIIQTAIVKTQFSQQSLTPESTSTPTKTNTPTNTHTPTSTSTSTITLTPTITFTPTISLTPTITSTPTTTPTYTPQPGIGDEFSCGKYFTITVLEQPTFVSVLPWPSSDKANGIFLIVNVRLVNETDKAIWVWGDDYTVQGEVDGKVLTFPRDDASIDLQLLYDGNSNQEEIGPSLVYDTLVAFDVNPEGVNWKFILQPSELCDVKIPLTDN